MTLERLVVHLNRQYALQTVSTINLRDSYHSPPIILCNPLLCNNYSFLHQHILFEGILAVEISAYE